MQIVENVQGPWEQAVLEAGIDDFGATANVRPEFPRERAR
jgi:hypothetical protein